MIKFKDLTESLSLNESKTLDDIKSMLKKAMKLKESDFKVISNNRIAVLTDNNRIKTMEQIANLLVPIGWKWNRTTKISSIGHLELEEAVILVKPKSKQGSLSAGLDNEARLVGGINQAIILNGGSLDVVFSSGRNKAHYTGIKKAVQVGSDTANRKKADLLLITEKGKQIPISLKKDNANMWESADNLWGLTANKFINKLVQENKIKLERQNAGHFKISPQFAVKASPTEVKEIVFGSDILSGKGCVIERTFVEKDFEYVAAKNQVVIQCSAIIKSVDDIPASATPWFLIRNDSSRHNPAIGYTGLRVLAVYQERINQTVLKVHRNLVK